MSVKVTTFPEISLVKKGEIISNESKVASSLSTCFDNDVRSLGIKTK